MGASYLLSVDTKPKSFGIMKRCKCKQDERIEQIFVTAIKAKGTQIVSTLCIFLNDVVVQSVD